MVIKKNFEFKKIKARIFFNIKMMINWIDFGQSS